MELLRKANSVVTRRPRAVLLSASIILASLARALERLDEGSSASSWWSVALALWVTFAAGTCLSFPRLSEVPPRDVAATRCVLALTPASGAFVAKVAELVEMWTYYLAAIVSLALLAASTRASTLARASD